MELTQLPIELFQEILRHAIVVRGIKRGLRLRLLNSAYCRSRNPNEADIT
jgi:hypothetical protein